MMLRLLLALGFLGWASGAHATVSTASNASTIACNGSQTSFTFSFPAVATSDIGVTVTTSAGVATTLLTSQYSLTLNPTSPGQIWGAGGVVTYPLIGSACPGGSVVTIARTLPYLQNVSLQNQASFGQYAKAAETATDLLAMQIQQLNNQIGHQIGVPLSDSTPALLPPSAQRANQGMAFDGSGNPIAAAIPSSGIISSAMQPVVNAASLALGRTAFGLGTMAVEGIGGGLQDDGASNARVIFSPNAVAVNQSITAAAHLQKYVATGPINFSLPRANTLWSGFGFWVDVSSGPVTLIPNASDTISQVGTSGASLVMPIGNTAYVYTNAASSGTWYVEWGSLQPINGGPTSATLNYTIAPSDCGTPVRAGTGSTGQLTVTLAAAGGFPASCIITVRNGDSARGKILSGFPAELFTVLWPLQTVQVQNVNSAWVTTINPGRWVQKTTTALNVDTSLGSDSNDCLATGTAACRTLQNAVNIVLNQMAFSGGAPTINVADGTITESVSCSSAIVGSPNTLNLTGNNTTPTNAIWTPPNFVPPSGGYALLAANGCNISLSGFYFSSAGTPCVWLDAFGGNISVNHVNFGALTINPALGCGFQILVDGGSNYSVLGNDYTISGNMTYHILAVGPAKVEWTNTQIYIPNPLTFTNFYLMSGSGANVNYDATIVCFDHSGGTAGAGGCGTHSIGSPYNVIGNANISTNSSTIPGNGVGVLVGGGCVDLACGVGIVQTTPNTFASLGACNGGKAGTIAAVTNSSTVTWGANSDGAGANYNLVSCNGANWTVVGK